jgi:hypothetical protein
MAVGFLYMKQIFENQRGRIKEGIFVGPQIREIMTVRLMKPKVRLKVQLGEQLNL